MSGVRIGRQRHWIRVTSISVPTVWMATAEGLVCLDLVAVELAANGLRKGWTLTPDEARYTARLLLDREVPYSIISQRVGANTETLRSWFPGEIAPASEQLARPQARPQCGTRRGTRRGYRWHRARLEPPCPDCLEGNRVADRHYKEHGTYVGAPICTAVAA
ncbi:hypothetical protein JHN52_01250 [Streptomyces sp. MBT97]|uniref:hypothetical protein n=1 Tax=Streptomyces sp. MBT97 TaxID=2800411 RepID=UPI001909B41E|nr:hypothetical protein [Streptomyces sp. MBT97]MBK3631607.1 hypothetical protein [Streptomyces sp. MBT97]